MADDRVPVCSASNYLLGLSPLRYAPYISGTLAGMAVWSTVYASLGGASRTLLQSGVEPDVLLAGALEPPDARVPCLTPARRSCPARALSQERLIWQGELPIGSVRRGAGRGAGDRACG